MDHFDLPDNDDEFGAWLVEDQPFDREYVRQAVHRVDFRCECGQLDCGIAWGPLPATWDQNDWDNIDTEMYRYADRWWRVRKADGVVL